jgi:hypothetical protein
MKAKTTAIWAAGGIFIGAAAASAVPIHVTHLWHMHQPIYYPYETPGTIDATAASIQRAGRVGRDRVQCYQNWPAGAVGRASGHGASQMSYRGRSRKTTSRSGATTRGGAQRPQRAQQLKTSSGNSRLDLVGIAYHHSLMPLTSVESMRMQIKLHKEQYKEAWATGGAYSKGFWPPECAFDNSMVPALVEEGLEWVIVDNGHLFRTAEDFAWRSASSCRPNKADVRNGSSTNLASTWVTLPNVWAPTKCSRLVLPAALRAPRRSRQRRRPQDHRRACRPLRRQRKRPRRLRRFKPETSGAARSPPTTIPNKPMLLLLHSDGDNYGMKNSDPGTASTSFRGHVQRQRRLRIHRRAGLPVHVSAQSERRDPRRAWQLDRIDGGTRTTRSGCLRKPRGVMPDSGRGACSSPPRTASSTPTTWRNSYFVRHRDVNDVEWASATTRPGLALLPQRRNELLLVLGLRHGQPWDGNPTRACNLAIAEATRSSPAIPSGDTRGPSHLPAAAARPTTPRQDVERASNAPSDFWCGRSSTI